MKIKVRIRGSWWRRGHALRKHLLTEQIVASIGGPLGHAADMIRDMTVSFIYKGETFEHTATSVRWHNPVLYSFDSRHRWTFSRHNLPGFGAYFNTMLVNHLNNNVSALKITGDRVASLVDELEHCKPNPRLRAAS